MNNSPFDRYADYVISYVVFTLSDNDDEYEDMPNVYGQHLVEVILQ
jgi:hypothetical protein